MTLRNGHGNGAGVPRVEVLPADELPGGVPAGDGYDSRAQRDDQGRFARGNEHAAKGGRARASTTRLARRMGLAELPESAAFAPYRRAAGSFRRFHVSALATTVGGGVCGPGPASIVATAAWQLAASRYLFDQAALTGAREDFALASRLGDASRQSLLAAHELCAREAQGRPRPRPAWLDLLAPARPADSLSPPDGPSSVEGAGDAAPRQPEPAPAENGGPS